MKWCSFSLCLLSLPFLLVLIFIVKDCDCGYLYDDHDHHESVEKEYYMYDQSGQLIQLVEKKKLDKKTSDCSSGVSFSFWGSWWPYLLFCGLPLISLPFFMINYDNGGGGHGGGHGGGGGGGWGGKGGMGMGGGNNGYYEIWARDHKSDEKGRKHKKGSKRLSGRRLDDDDKNLILNLNQTTQTVLQSVAKLNSSLLKTR